MDSGLVLFLLPWAPGTAFMRESPAWPPPLAIAASSVAISPSRGHWAGWGRRLAGTHWATPQPTAPGLPFGLELRVRALALTRERGPCQL